MALDGTWRTLGRAAESQLPPHCCAGLESGPLAAPPRPSLPQRADQVIP
jgi:hypothetical protein